MKVLKFGGSSLATPATIRDVADIVLDARGRDQIVLVVSAFQDVTNQLLEAARIAERADTRYRQVLGRIARRHRVAAAQLCGANEARVRGQVDALLEELTSTLAGVHLLRHCPVRALDMTASFGERLSSVIVSAYLNKRHPSVAVDARDFIVTDDQFTHAVVNFKKTNLRARRLFARLSRGRTRGAIPVVTGFIGATEDGQTTTIGRNGSDYTAAIVGGALRAATIEIWTDVDGVLSADPRIVQSAFVLPEMTYEEAMELSYFGAKVLHAGTITPAVARRIPIVIKNTFKPDAPGTIISSDAGEDGRIAKGVTSVGDLSLLTLRGPGMVGVPGVAGRLFRALAAHRVSVVLISQASSEHTICIGVRSADADRAVRAIADEFQFEMRDQLMRIDQKADQAILAVVGEGMKGRPGVSGKLFDSLGRQNINVTAIAQGGSEHNISCVIDASQQGRALNAIHQAFFESRTRLALAFVGVGNVGSAVLAQLYQQREHLLSRGFDVTVVAVANSKRFVCEPEGINLASWQETLRQSPRRMESTALAQSIRAMQLTHGALVDCTVGPAVVDAYPAFIDANLHIITPNKWANALPWDRYTSLMNLLESRRKHFLFEANVGAGLPIVSTLRDLVDSGDEIVRIDGILSGTLSYLFNTYDGSVPFSSLVAEAHRNGFTEPDPREDLSGNDVARKLLILARLLGLRMDLRDVAVDSLVPAALRRGAYSDRFLTAYERYDARIRRRFKAAESRDAVLRYVGTLENGKATAGLEEFPRRHPVAAATSNDNVIAFTTKRYARTPLVVQGPGAGADVTATGVFSDILKLLHYLPR